MVDYKEIETDEELNNLKNAILVNIYLNTSFNSTVIFLKSDLVEFFQLFGGTQKDENTLAQLILLLHVSKAKSSSNADNFFQYVTTTRIFNSITTNDDACLKEFSDIFELLFDKKLVKSVIEKVIFNVTNTNHNNCDMSDTKLKFFVSNFKGLEGFAGINTVQIS